MATIFSNTSLAKKVRTFSEIYLKNPTLINGKSALVQQTLYTLGVCWFDSGLVSKPTATDHYPNQSQPNIPTHICITKVNELISIITYVCGSELGNYWLRKWRVAYSAPSHYLKQCGCIINGTNCSEFWILMLIFFQENAFQNVGYFVRVTISLATL